MKLEIGNLQPWESTLFSLQNVVSSNSSFIIMLVFGGVWFIYLNRMTVGITRSKVMLKQIIVWKLKPRLATV